MIARLHSGVVTLRTIQAWLTEKIEFLGPFWKRAIEYTAMFTALWIIYSSRIKGSNRCIAITFDFAFTLQVVKFFLLTGWPFALVACLDTTWRDKDAARVFLAAYIATNVFWIHAGRCGFCPYSAPFLMFPYILSALAGHRIGSWRHAARIEEWDEQTVRTGMREMGMKAETGAGRDSAK
jgi:hypothetical protein